MRKAILTVLMALLLVIPAYAAESGDDSIVDQANQQVNTPPTDGHLDRQGQTP